MYQLEGRSIPAISASASKDKDGKIHITLANVNPNSAVEVDCDFRGEKTGMKIIGARILTAKETSSYNTFENPNEVVSGDFNSYKMINNKLNVMMPSKSVIMLELR
jgi:alpha-N-arabinofuranosidase